MQPSAYSCTAVAAQWQPPPRSPLVARARRHESSAPPALSALPLPPVSPPPPLRRRRRDQQRAGAEPAARALVAHVAHRHERQPRRLPDEERPAGKTTGGCAVIPPSAVHVDSARGNVVVEIRNGRAICISSRRKSPFTTMTRKSSIPIVVTRRRVVVASTVDRHGRSAAPFCDDARRENIMEKVQSRVATCATEACPLRRRRGVAQTLRAASSRALTTHHGLYPRPRRREPRPAARPPRRGKRRGPAHHRGQSEP